jgi:prefoldin alpha subunit
MEMNQALFERAQLAYQQAQAHEERLNFLNQQIGELETFNESLKQIEHNTEGQFMTSLGKGVFVKTKRLDSDFLVDVGANVMVKKELGDIQGTLEEQVKRLTELREEVKDDLNELQQELAEMMGDVSHSE